MSMPTLMAIIAIKKQQYSDITNRGKRGRRSRLSDDDRNGGRGRGSSDVEEAFDNFFKKLPEPDERPRLLQEIQYLEARQGDVGRQDTLDTYLFLLSDEELRDLKIMQAE